MCFRGARRAQPFEAPFEAQGEQGKRAAPYEGTDETKTERNANADSSGHPRRMPLGPDRSGCKERK
jgi:hypothetical protein